MLVQSVMTRSVVTTEPHCSLQSAEELMREHRFRHLPVVANGRLVGIVSDRDVLRSQCRAIGEVMRANVISVTPDTPVEVAARLMLDNKIGALPVVGEGLGHLVGIVTQTDLFAVLARLLGGEGPSTRLELRLTDLPRQLAQLTALACHWRMPITSLVVLPSTPDDAGHRVVVLRIGTMQFGPFLAALRESGIGVNLPEELEIQTPAGA